MSLLQIFPLNSPPCVLVKASPSHSVRLPPLPPQTVSAALQVPGETSRRQVSAFYLLRRGRDRQLGEGGVRILLPLHTPQPA